MRLRGSVTIVEESFDCPVDLEETLHGVVAVRGHANGLGAAIQCESLGRVDNPVGEERSLGLPAWLTDRGEGG